MLATIVNPQLSATGQATLQGAFPYAFVPYNTLCLVILLQLRKQDQRGKVNCSQLIKSGLGFETRSMTLTP